jgi:hypothetical protein
LLLASLDKGMTQENDALLNTKLYGRPQKKKMTKRNAQWCSLFIC